MNELINHCQVCSRRLWLMCGSIVFSSVNVIFVWLCDAAVTHSSVADHGRLSSLQFEHVPAVGGVGEQEVKLQIFVCLLEQCNVHALRGRQEKKQKKNSE